MKSTSRTAQPETPHEVADVVVQAQPGKAKAPRHKYKGSEASQTMASKGPRMSSSLPLLSSLFFSSSHLSNSIFA